jgi:bacillithiol synthase
VQVEKKQSAVHLFYHDPDRTAIHFLDDSFHVGEKRLGLPGILDLIDRNPEKFSSDVLTRPLWQSYLFPVVAQVEGPSEIAYLGQIGKLFRLFDLARPRYFPRASATILEKRSEELMDKYNIKMDDLTGDIEQLINKIAADSFPADIEEIIQSFRRKMNDEYARFEKAMIAYDESLEPNSKQTYGKIDFALSNFEKKIFGQHKKKMESVRHQIYKLAELLYPNKNSQERSLNINYFIAKYGFGVVGYIARSLDVGTTEHQTIRLSEFV